MDWRAPALAGIRVPVLLLWAVAWFLAAVEALSFGEPLLAYAGWIAWPLVIIVHDRALYRRDDQPLARNYHPLGLWLIAWLGMLEMQARVLRWDGPALIWMEIAWIAMPLLLMLGVTLLGRRLPWPTRKHFDLYIKVALSVPAALLGVWTVAVNLTNPGEASPLPYLPLLNPLGITQLLIFAALFAWLWRLAQAGVVPNTLRAGYVAMAALIFLWINAGLPRVWLTRCGASRRDQRPIWLCHVAGDLSILWTLLAMVLMFAGTHRGQRWMWLTGGGLLSLTVAKLLLVDLSRTGTLGRIVSFIVVGLLMLLIGYFAPIPPRGARADTGGRRGSGCVKPGMMMLLNPQMGQMHTLKLAICEIELARWASLREVEQLCAVLTQPMLRRLPSFRRLRRTPRQSCRSRFIIILPACR